MAVFLSAAADYLTRTTELLSTAGNRTWIIWTKQGTIPTSGGKNLAMASINLTPSTYTQYGRIVQNDTPRDQLALNIDTSVETHATSASADVWTHHAWVTSGTSQRYYRNGSFVGSIGQNLAHLTSTYDLLGGDSTGVGNYALAYCRQWTTALTQNEILAELQSTIAVKTANLWMDCPLTADTLDLSGLNHCWTVVGSVSYVASPTFPSNGTAATATALSTLPQTLTQDFGDGLEAWYSYTGHVGEVMAGFWAYADLTNDQIDTTVYESDGTTVFLGIASAHNRPIQVPQSSGTLIYLKVASTSGHPPTVDVTLSALPGPTSAVPSGAICINDDTVGFPLAYLSATTGQPLSFQVFPASERGTPATNTSVLPSGITLTDDIDLDVFHVYDATLQTQLATVAYPFNTGTPEATNSDQDATFYVSGWVTGGNARVATISDAGVVGGTTWTLSGHAFTLCPTLDNTLLYYADGSNGAKIKTWVLGTNMAGADFAAGVSGYQIRDILNLADGTFAVGYHRTADSFVRIYASDGSTVADYASFGGATQVNHLCHAIDDPNSIWVWLFEVSGTTPTGNSRFVNLKVSDGTFLSDLTGLAQYENGEYSPATTADPQRFGHSNSCPIWILRSAFVPPVPPAEPEEFFIRRERWFPVISSGLKRQFFSKLQIDLQAGNGLSTGQGSNPLMEIDWSDDSGWTWSNIRFVETGRIGAYGWRPIARNLSYGRNRVFRIAVSDPVQWVVVGADLDAVLGNS
jgi:hypothetical protein